MTGHDHNNQGGPGGFSRAKLFHDLIWYLKQHLKPVADVNDPLTRLNRCILDAYLKAVVEDGRVRTGFRYNDQSGDDTVSSAAAKEFGQPVSAAQVSLV
jgi:hypothetical protein